MGHHSRAELDQIRAMVLEAQGAVTSGDRSRLEGAVVVWCRPMSWGLARRYRDRGADLEDLRAVADEAVLGATRRFDEVRGEFVGFASITVLGSIRRHFRDSCWAIRPPRSVQELHARLRAAAEEMEESGTPVTTRSLAAHVGVPVRQVMTAAGAAGCFSLPSLDAAGAESVQVGTGDAGYTVAEARVMTAGLCSDLAERDRELIRLRFVEARSQQDIAVRVGRSQRQVSRDLETILGVLRARLGLDPVSDLSRTG